MRRRLIGSRSPLLALGTIAASSLTLAGCAGDAPSEVMYTSVQQCVQAGMNQDVCQAGYDDALQAHLASAPRFDDVAVCEAEYGAGQCTVAPAQDTANGTQETAGGTGGNFFVPFLAGYLMSSAINNLTAYNTYRQDRLSNGYPYGSSPIYRNRSGDYLTPSSGGGSRDTSVAPSRQSMSSVNVNSNTHTVSRSGFGGRSSGTGLGG